MPHRRNGAETRAAILRTAARTIRARSYQAATLEEIADEVGVTRAAVLHHFGSKDAVLRTLARPLFDEVDRILDRVEEAGRPFDAHAQRATFTAIVEVVCEHRDAAVILFRDITAHEHLGPDLQISDRASRLARLVMANSDDPDHLVRILAALGAVFRPLSAPDELIDLSTADRRAVLVECALAALRAKPRRARTTHLPARVLASASTN
jgi:AcrR family transcriptional regulator